jgi:hypothetical protein
MINEVFPHLNSQSLEDRIQTIARSTGSSTIFRMCMNHQTIAGTIAHLESNINHFHTWAEFEELARAVNCLLQTAGIRRKGVVELMTAFPETRQRNLLIKMVEGVEGLDLYTEIAIHTDDTIFSQEEWNYFGHRCLTFNPKPPRLWLAIGANSTEPTLIQMASSVAYSALGDSFPWSFRSGQLFRRLVANLKQLDSRWSHHLETFGQSRGWVPLSSRDLLAQIESLNSRPTLAAQHCLLTIAASFRNADYLNIEMATLLWNLGRAKEPWSPPMEAAWRLYHLQIASRLPGSGHGVTVLNTWPWPLVGD